VRGSPARLGSRHSGWRRGQGHIRDGREPGLGALALEHFLAVHAHVERCLDAKLDLAAAYFEHRDAHRLLDHHALARLAGQDEHAEISSR
jgi:hypothetical protein